MNGLLADIIRELTPIHEAMAAHEKGGPACAKAIERIYRDLSELGGLEADVDDLKSDLDFATDEIERLEAALDKANDLLLAAGLIKEPL